MAMTCLTREQQSALEQSSNGHKIIFLGADIFEGERARA